jgi:hypothetical protein
MTDSNSGNNANSAPQNGNTVVWNGQLTGASGGWTVTVPTTNIPQGQWYTVTIPYPVQQVLPGMHQTVQAEETKAEEKKKDSDGCTCKKCKEFFPYAEPNQEDGTLVCYGCRMHW